MYKMVERGINMKNNYLFKVNLGGMIDILSNHLYSKHHVFIREVLQNSVDAIMARKNIDSSWNEGKISVSLIEDRESKTIVFEDNGIGLTEEEIHRFIAILGESSKKDITSGKVQEDYIGQFGIGLLSCFMVSEEINLVTHSIKDNESYHWIGKPDGTYTIKPLGSGLDYGTTVYLRFKEDCESYYDIDRVFNLIKYYASALSIPIYIVNNGVEVMVNAGKAIWELEQLNVNDIIAVGQEVFGEEFLDYIPLESEAGEVKGYAFILSHKVGPKAKKSHRIYLKNMLLTEEADKLLPEWAFFVRCIINTDSLKPTAARDGFYEDELLLETKKELGQCIVNYLSSIATTDTKKLSKIVEIHDLAIKSLAIENDSLYKIFFDYLLFQTSQGTKTGFELRTQYYRLQYTDTVEKFKQIAPIYTAQNKLLINGGYVYVTEIIEKLPDVYTGQWVELVDNSDVMHIMDELSYVEEEASFKLIKVANVVLNKFKCKADIKHFKPVELPVLYTIDTDAMLYRDLVESREKAKDSFGDILDGFINEFEGNSYSNLCFNYDNPIVQKLMKLTDEEALKNCITLLYVQALLMGHYPLRNNELQLLNDGIISLVEWGIGK